MSGYGIYANPFSDDWDDKIEITEFSTPQYNKNVLIPTRYLLDFKYDPYRNKAHSNNWKQVDECEMSIRDLYNNSMIEEFYCHNNKMYLLYNSIKYLPKLSSKDSENSIWQLNKEEVVIEPAKYVGFFATHACTEITAFQISYGDLLDEDSTKLKMRFEKNGDIYKLVESNNYPVAWKEFYQNPPEFKSTSATEQFLYYATLKALFPEQLKNLKYEESSSGLFLTGTNGKINGKDLAIKMLENGKIIPGFSPSEYEDIKFYNKAFISFSDFVTKYIYGKEIPQRDDDDLDSWSNNSLNEKIKNKFIVRKDIDYNEGKEKGLSKEQMNLLCYEGADYIAKMVIEHPTDIGFILKFARNNNNKFDYKDIYNCIQQYSEEKNELDVDYKKEQIINNILQMILRMEDADKAITKTREIVGEQLENKDLGFNIPIGKMFENFENILENNQEMGRE